MPKNLPECGLALHTVYACLHHRHHTVRNRLLPSSGRLCSIRHPLHLQHEVYWRSKSRLCGSWQGGQRVPHFRWSEVGLQSLTCCEMGHRLKTGQCDARLPCTLATSARDAWSLSLAHLTVHKQTRHSASSTAAYLQTVRFVVSANNLWNVS